MAVRPTLQDTARRSQTYAARATLRESDDEHFLQEAKALDVRNSETHTGVETFENYGFTSVNFKQDEKEEDKKGQQQQQQDTGDSGPGGKGGGDGARGKQPEGDAAEAIVLYLGSHSHPVTVVQADRRHRVTGKDNKKTKPGDVYMHRGKDDATQIMMLEGGLYQTARNDRKVRIALVPKPQKQQPSQQQQAEAGGAGGQSGSGGGKQEDKGQEPQFEQSDKSDTFIDVTSGSIHQGRGDGHHEVKGDKVLGYHQKPEHSYKADKEHVHIYFDDNHVWVDKKNIYSSKPILIKKDECKP